MRILALTFLLFVSLLFVSSCVVSGGRAKTRVQTYSQVDTASAKSTPDSVELFFKGEPLPKFAYDKVARITITGAQYDYSAKLVHLLAQKAKEIYCDAVVYIEFTNVQRHYWAVNLFGDDDSKDITVLEITGLAVKKRESVPDSIHKAIE